MERTDTRRIDKRLAWIVLAILGCAAILGFGHGLSQATSAAPSRRGDPGGVATSAGEPRQASPLPTLDEARVRQIAREEADAAVVRARPKRPAPPKPTPDLNATDDTNDDAAVPIGPPPPTISTPPPG